MTESEILQSLLASSAMVSNHFSTFLAIVFAYVAGLYFFLNQAPVVLKLLAFALLSIGLAFVGISSLVQEHLQEELLAAWAKLPNPAVSLEVLQSPVTQSSAFGLSFYEIGIAIAWLAALGMYLGLAYMTFAYRWK